MRTIAEQIGNWCHRYSDMTECELEVVKYGLELMIGTVIKYILLLLIGLFCGKAVEVAIVLTVVAAFRCFAGGVHARTDIGCFGCMLAICAASVGLAELSLYLRGVIIPIAGYAWIIYAVCRYAPLQSVKNPIRDNKVIAKKKIYALLTVAVDLAAFILYPNANRWIYMYPLLIEATTIMLTNEKRRRGNEQEA